MIEDVKIQKEYWGKEITCDGIIKYINEHAETGVETVVNCKNCDYWRKYEDSAQGKCVLLGISPTGAWYCADGRKTMTCKNCLHYEVCNYHICEETDMTVDECPHFADRSEKAMGKKNERKN